MDATLSRSRLVLQIAAVFALMALAASARADIFQWKYDRNDNKVQSATLAPDGAGVDAVPGAELGDRDLTMAYLIGVNLTGASLFHSTLNSADLSLANLAGANLGSSSLTNAKLSSATLTGADLSGAVVASASFSSTTSRGFTKEQLYSRTEPYRRLPVCDADQRQPGWGQPCRRPPVILDADECQPERGQSCWCLPVVLDADKS
jgi:uncharacterized protein YjbI with pentapeptide repeats